MPEITGIVLATEAKRLNPAMVIVLISAFDLAPEELSQVVQKVPVDDLIRKPVTTAAFVAAIKKSLGMVSGLDAAD
jgi:two-component SAPR family response regulator